ncbi:MAG: cyanophycinase [Nonlabens sp.]
MVIKGTLIPIGGNEDRGADKPEHLNLEFIGEGILARVLKEAGGKDSKIVIIPTASSIPVEMGSGYIEAFNKLGCQSTHVLDIRTREDALEEHCCTLVNDADCVLFTGGNQSHITNKIGGTPLHSLLSKRYVKENFVIAGTSAGAMCMSHEMITGGSAKESFLKGAVGMNRGMSFIPGLIIDSHFIRRGRFGRLAEAVSRFPHLLGIGLAEDTGLVIKKGKVMEVIGSGMVIVFDPRKLSFNNQQSLELGEPMTITNLSTHVLASGDRFNLNKRKIAVLPAGIDTSYY